MLTIVVMDAWAVLTYTSQDVHVLGNQGHMSSQTDERQQIQLELEGLKRTLEWSEIQREHLFDRLDLLRLDNARLQDRLEELERQVDGLKKQQPLF